MKIYEQVLYKLTEKITSRNIDNQVKYNMVQQRNTLGLAVNYIDMVITM